MNLRFSFAGAALAGAALASSLSAAPLPECLVAVGQGELPASLEWSRDVRWAGDRNLFLSLRLQGVVEWKPGDPEAVLRAPRGYGRGELYLPEHLATTADRLVVGSAVFAFGFGSRSGVRLDAIFPWEEIGDLDARDDRIAIYGSQRDARGDYAPEGALAWFGKLGDDPERLRPLFLSESGPQMPNFARCGRMSIGAIRFLADGAIFLIPGVEGGAYLFDPGGHLLRVYSAADLGIDSGCPLDQKAADRYGIDEEGRWEWINRRRVVDDILPLPDGRIGVIVREFRDQQTRFELALLGRGGEITRCPLPIASDQEFARLRGDVRGNEIVILVSQEGFRPKRLRETNMLTGESRELPPVLHPAKKTRYFFFRYPP